MRLPHYGKKKARIEIIPMIDTMFFLLVFFMIATLSMTLQKGMPVNLPTSGAADVKVPTHIALSLTTKGELFFDKDPIAIGDVAPRLNRLLMQGQEPSVVINADKDVTHGRVIEVMDIVKHTGITAMAIATKPR